MVQGSIAFLPVTFQDEALFYCLSLRNRIIQALEAQYHSFEGHDERVRDFLL